MNFLLEESTTEQVPVRLNDIVKQLLFWKEPIDLRQKDLFFILIVVLMLENGFSPVTQTSSGQLEYNSQALKEQLFDQKTDTYRDTFILSGLHDIVVDIIMSPLGSATIVNAIVNNKNSEIYSVCLPVSRYVVSPQASTIPMMFRDLKHLSNIFRNKIVAPVKSSILSYCGYPSASLLGIPEDTFFSIMMLLDTTDILNVLKTCKRIKAIIDSPCFWHSLFKRDFGSIEHSEDINWKQQYKEKYEDQQSKKPSSAGTMHDFMDVSDMVSYIDNPLWEII
ncbi:F-box only protein 7-like [Leptidea sinapis]|uniref:F-box only protein 7-like n=1 Tax=Leptidea sinapis TaxID=189913 RepID=UPI00213531F7|nr:F-box only protein 7-like [Leptidea sinapis]